MLNASSKDALRRSLVGVAMEFQATDFSEIARESGTGHFTSLRIPLFTPDLYSARQGLS